MKLQGIEIRWISSSINYLRWIYYSVIIFRCTHVYSPLNLVKKRIIRLLNCCFQNDYLGDNCTLAPISFLFFFLILILCSFFIFFILYSCFFAKRSIICRNLAEETKLHDRAVIFSALSHRHRASSSSRDLFRNTV